MSSAAAGQSSAPYEQKEVFTRFDYLVQWTFDAPIVEEHPCEDCGVETTRLSRVREVFGSPLCVRCWGERRSRAPKRGEL